MTGDFLKAKVKNINFTYNILFLTLFKKQQGYKVYMYIVYDICIKNGNIYNCNSRVSNAICIDVSINGDNGALHFIEVRALIINMLANVLNRVL